MRANFNQDWLSTLRTYLAASAGLHLTWEVAQLPLYTIWQTGTRGEIAFAVVHCTAGDLMIATLALVTALIVFGNTDWPKIGFPEIAAVTMILGVGYTLYSEWINTVVRQSWAYAEWMPTVPGLGTGLSPLLQWLVVPSIALALAGRGVAKRVLQ